MSLDRLTEGLWIIVNDKKNKIWLGQSRDCLAQVRTKLGVIDKRKRTGRVSYYNIPDSISEDLKEQYGDIVHRTYSLVYNLKGITDFIIKNPYYKEKYGDMINIREIVRNFLKSFVASEMFEEYDLYSHRDSVLLQKLEYEKHRELILNLICNGVITIYKRTHNELGLASDELSMWEKQKIEHDETHSSFLIDNIKIDCKILKSSVKQEIELEIEKDISKDHIKTQNLEVSDELYEMLQLESIIQQISVEKILSKNISLKTREVYNIMKQYKDKVLMEDTQVC